MSGRMTEIQKLEEYITKLEAGLRDIRGQALVADRSWLLAVADRTLRSKNA